MNVYTKRFNTPGGEMLVAVDEDGAVIYLALPNGHKHWEAEVARRHYTVTPNSSRCDVAIGQLDEYFRQQRRHFDLTLRPHGTDFQQKVWGVLQMIPYGTTITYKELADRIGLPAAIRAVGRANGTNPIPIIVACHRVIGSDGSLTGFGGGLPLKALLLKLEGVSLPSVREPSRQLLLL